MGYKIEEVGFEYRDHKLGQMTDIGRIIGLVKLKDRKDLILKYRYIKRTP